VESDNVAVVRRVHELFNRLDPDPSVRAGSPELAELLSLFDPDVEFIQPPGELDSAEHHGSGAFERSWADWLDMWEEMRTDLYETAESGDSVLALSRNSYKGRDGIAVDVDGGGIFTVSGGRITRMLAYFDSDEARRAFEAQAES